VVILILSQVSFAQEAAPEPGVSAVPFTYMAPAQKLFGGKFSAIVGKRLRAPQMLPVAVPGDAVAAPVALPYPYGISDLRPSAVRRVARLTQPQIKYVPYPVPVAVAPPAGADPAAAAGGVPGGSAIYAPGPVAQTGQKNFLTQRSGGPVINLMSIVRLPRSSYDPYVSYPPYQAQP
jgi:hypothetical protein